MLGVTPPTSIPPFSSLNPIQNILFFFMIYYFVFNLPGKISNYYNPPKNMVSNAFPPSTEMDLFVYLSQSTKFQDFDDKEALVWKEDRKSVV